MKYLCLLHISESEGPGPGTPAYAQLVAENIALVGEMTRAGVLVDSAPLHPTRSATTIRVRDDETLMTDGPYAELKEQLGGYYLLECADLDEALRWAVRIPAAQTGAVEVRPVIDVRRRD